MKNILYLLLVVTTFANAQPITQMPTFIGNPGANAWIPIVIGNTNRKIASDVLFNNLFSTKSTTDITEGSKQFFTLTRARAAINGIGGISYNPSTGEFSANYSVLDGRYTTNINYGPTIKFSGELTDVDRTQLPRNCQVIADANYTITPDDETIILPQPSVVRNLVLPAASTMQGLSVTIIDAAVNSNAWVLMGSFVQKGTTGTTPFVENFTNSGLLTTQRLRLQSINDNGTWRWFDTY